MQLVDWAFEQQLPRSDKIVLVWLARHANSVGVGLMDRARLAKETGYKTRSIQRVLQSLRGAMLLAETGRGAWYRIGPIEVRSLAEQLEELPEDMQLLPPRGKNDINYSESITEPVDPELIGQVVADIVGNQIAAMGHDIQLGIDRIVMAAHVKQLDIEPEPVPIDPVLENPLYQDLIALGKSHEVAYSLSESDISMEVVEAVALLKDISDPEYDNNAGGRFERILDVLHGVEAATHDTVTARKDWGYIEDLENKHTVKGETDAFLLLYPAIVAAAKANVGKTTLDKFIDVAGYKAGQALWDQESNALDKEDPALNIEIAKMLGDLNARNDPRCTVQPRTKETGDDGVVRTETLRGFYLRVKGKHNQMIEMQNMGIFDVG